MKTRTLIALDIDGTLINSNHEITPATRQAIHEARKAGAEIILSTGRVYNALPFHLLDGLDFQYAITTNGAAVYKLPDKTCLFENCMALNEFLPILAKLQACDIMIHLYIDGECYHTASKHRVIDQMDVSYKRKEYLHSIGNQVDDLVSFALEKGHPIQKVTLGFYPLPDGTYKHHDELENFLRSNPALSTVCGGDTTLEITKAGVSKGIGLRFLAEHLRIPMEQTIACGDSENDLDMLQTASIGVAMENASHLLKEAADFITCSNDEDGVAHMLHTLVLHQLTSEK